MAKTLGVERLDKNALRRFLRAALHPPVKDDTARRQRHTGGWVFKPVALSDRLEFPDIFILQSK
jgi:hypothetical protein